MKLDMGKAWADASRMLGSNRELVMVLTGIFFFLPLLLLFQTMFGFDWNFGPEPTPEQIEGLINDFISQNWWAIAIVMVAQLCGTIALLKLLADSQNPTVGEVIKSIPKLIIPVFVAQVLVTLITQSLSLIAGLLPGAIGQAMSFVFFFVTIYLTIKFSLVGAEIVIGHNSNPFAALGASWQLTKGNSIRILLFFIAIFLVGLLLGIIMFITVGLVLALLGPAMQEIGTAVLLATLAAIYGAVSVAVIASIYRQLSGLSGQSTVRTTFL